MSYEKYTDFRNALNVLYTEYNQAKKEYIELEKTFPEKFGKSVEYLEENGIKMDDLSKEEQGITLKAFSIGQKITGLLKDFSDNFLLLDKITMLCQLQGITVAELERTLNFSNSSMRRWNTSLPSIDKVVKVADFFNISLDDLLDREVDVNESKSFLLDEVLANDESISVGVLENGKKWGLGSVKFKTLTAAEKIMLLAFAKSISIPSENKLMANLGIEGDLDEEEEEQ